MDPPHPSYFGWNEGHYPPPQHICPSQQHHLSAPNPSYPAPCPTLPLDRPDDPSPSLMASLLHLVDRAAPPASSSAPFPTTTTSLESSPPPPFLAGSHRLRADEDDREWDAAVAYLSTRQPWPLQEQYPTQQHQPRPMHQGATGGSGPTSNYYREYPHNLTAAPQPFYLAVTEPQPGELPQPAASHRQRLAAALRKRELDSDINDVIHVSPAARYTPLTHTAVLSPWDDGGGYLDGDDRRDALYDQRLRCHLITPNAATASRMGAHDIEEDVVDSGDDLAWRPYSHNGSSSSSSSSSSSVQELGTVARPAAGNKARRIWTEDAHLRLAAMGLCYLDVYRKKVWVYATTHPSAMAPDNVRWTLERGFDGWTDKEDATLGVSVLTVLAQGAAQAGDKKTAKELFEKARQAVSYVGSDSSDYTLAEALVSIAIYAQIEGEMEDRDIHRILDMAMQICRRISALNSDAYHRCMFMKAILRFTSPDDLKMLDEAFCSVKSLPYYTYFVDGQSRQVMPYSMSVLQEIADTAIVLFHVIIALDLRDHGFASGCAPSGSADNDIIQLARALTNLEARLETIAYGWPPYMYLCLRMCSIAARAQCFWTLGLQRQAFKCIEDYIKLSQKRKQDSSLEYLGPPAIRADQMILSILAQKDDGELVSELFEAMKINEEKMPAIRKLRQRYTYLLDRKSPAASTFTSTSAASSAPRGSFLPGTAVDHRQPTAFPGYSTSSAPSSSFSFSSTRSPYGVFDSTCGGGSVVSAAQTASDACSPSRFLVGGMSAVAPQSTAPAPPQSSPTVVCLPPFSPEVPASGSASPPSIPATYGSSFSSSPSSSSSSSSTTSEVPSTAPASTRPKPFAPPPVRQLSPQSVDALLFGHHHHTWPSASASKTAAQSTPCGSSSSSSSSSSFSSSSSSSSMPASPFPPTTTTTTTTTAAENARFFEAMRRKERDMTALEQRMQKVKAKTLNLDERIESLEELVAVYETIVTAEQQGSASGGDGEDGSVIVTRPPPSTRRGSSAKAKAKIKAATKAKSPEFERSSMPSLDSMEMTTMPTIAPSTCSLTSSSSPRTSSSPMVSPDTQRLQADSSGGLPLLSSSSSSLSSSSSSSSLWPSSPELVFTDEEEFFRDIFAPEEK